MDLFTEHDFIILFLFKFHMILVTACDWPSNLVKLQLHVDSEWEPESNKQSQSLEIHRQNRRAIL